MSKIVIAASLLSVACAFAGPNVHAATSPAASFQEKVQNSDGSVTFVQPRFYFDGQKHRLVYWADMDFCQRMQMRKSIASTLGKFSFPDCVLRADLLDPWSGRDDAAERVSACNVGIYHLTSVTCSD